VDGLRRQWAESWAAFWLVSRNANLRRLLLGNAGSDIGHWAYDLAVSVFAYESAGATGLGLIWVLRMVSAALVSPLAGTLADRFPRVRVMVVSDLVRVGLITGAAASVWLDGPPAVVFAVAILVAVTATPFEPASRGLLPSLVTTPNELTAANVILSTIESVGFFVGPALGGILLALTSTSATFMVAAALAAWSALLVGRVRAPVAEHAAGGDRGILADGVAGFGTIFGNSRLRLLLGLMLATNLVDGALEVLIVVLALKTLALGSSGVGYLNAAFGIGALGGAFLCTRLIGMRRLSLPAVVGVLLWGAPLVVIGALMTPPVAYVCLVFVGVGYAVLDVASSTLIQRSVPDDVLSRVFGVIQSLWLAGLGVGALLISPLIAWLGTQGALVVAGCFLPVVVAVTAPRLLRIDAEAAAPDRTPLGLLRSIPMFAVLPDTTVEHLVLRLRPASFDKDVEIIREGDSGDRLYVIREGEVDVTADGRPVALLRAGDYVGEISLLRDVPRTATVKARTFVSAYTLDRADFLGTVTGYAPSTRAADAIAGARLAGLRRKRPIGITGV
jgi:MFS family permease